MTEGSINNKLSAHRARRLRGWNGQLQYHAVGCSAISQQPAGRVVDTEHMAAQADALLMNVPIGTNELSKRRICVPNSIGYLPRMNAEVATIKRRQILANLIYRESTTFSHTDRSSDYYPPPYPTGQNLSGFALIHSFTFKSRLKAHKQNNYNTMEKHINNKN